MKLRDVAHPINAHLLSS